MICQQNLMKSEACAVPVSNINDVKLNLNTIVLKNELGETWKRSRPCVIRPEEQYLRLLQLYMPQRNENELKQDNQSQAGRYKEYEGDICVI